jgi:hypothetical protein
MIAVLLIAAALAAPATCATATVAVASRREDRRRTLGSPRPPALLEAIARRVLDFRAEEALWPHPHGEAVPGAQTRSRAVAPTQLDSTAPSRSRHRKIA